MEQVMDVFPKYRLFKSVNRPRGEGNGMGVRRGTRGGQGDNSFRRVPPYQESCSGMAVATAMVLLILLR
jgi:hypothetical protein